MEKRPLSQRTPTPGAPGPRAPAPNQGRVTVGGPKILLLCPELSLSERWTRASLRKYLRSESLGVTDTATEIPITGIADRRESALYRFGTALGPHTKLLL